MVPGSFTGFHLSWKNTYTDEQTAIAVMSADMRVKQEGYLRIQMQDLEQTIILTPRCARQYRETAAPLAGPAGGLWQSACGQLEDDAGNRRTMRRG